MLVLAYEAWDAGDSIMLRKRGAETTIPFSNIVNISCHRAGGLFCQNPRMTLMLRNPCEFGREITFCATDSDLPGTMRTVAADLARRVDEANQQDAGRRESESNGAQPLNSTSAPQNRRKKISGRRTFFQKKVVPIIFPAAAIVGAVIMAQSDDGLNIGVVLLPVFAIRGYFVMKNNVFDLADDVWDEGDSILVHRDDTEIRIPFRNIMSINYDSSTKPTEITLVLRNPHGFVREVRFFPMRTSPSNGENTMVMDLINRVDEARRA